MSFFGVENVKDKGRKRKDARGIAGKKLICMPTGEGGDYMQKYISNVGMEGGYVCIGGFYQK
jgi:hypothetical protein